MILCHYSGSIRYCLYISVLVIGANFFSSYGICYLYYSAKRIILIASLSAKSIYLADKVSVLIVIVSCSISLTICLGLDASEFIVGVGILYDRFG